MAVANNPYPQDIRVRREATTLTDEGHCVSVVAPRSAGQRAHEVVDGVTVWRYRPPPDVRGVVGYAFEFAYVTLATFVWLHWVWLRRGVDVVHLHNPPDTLIMAAWPLKLLGRRVVFDHHDLAPELYAAKYAVPRGWIVAALRVFESWSCRSADLVVAVNESYRRSAIDRHGVSESRTVVVRNGPPIASTHPVAMDDSVRFSAPHLIGYLGHIATQDGVDHLIDALGRLEPDHGLTAWHAIVIGPAEDRTPLDAQVARLGLGPQITFAGFRPEPEWRAMLAACDVCVVPDPPNGLNERSTMIKMMDYMALGRAIVAYDLAEHRVSAGDAARYATPGDPASLANTIAEVLSDGAAREEMGRIGRERIEASLAWEYSAERLVAAYDAL